LNISKSYGQSNSGSVSLLLFIISGLTIVVFLIAAIWINNIAFAQEQQQPSTNTMGVKITSHSLWEKVPVGVLTISGMSADNAATNCQVYVDWNDQKPFQNATATGPGGANDYSTWTFTYTDKYYLIQKGLNDLTAKLSCNEDDSNNDAAKVTKYYSVNIIGVPPFGGN
jgi:uncharacterized protein with PQ loop repeat